MSSIKIKNTLFPCTDNPEIPYLRFHKDNMYYANLDPEEYMNNNYKPKKNNTSHKIGNAENIMGLVLYQEGEKYGTWKRIDENYNEIDFNQNHGTYLNMKEIVNDDGETMIEIPISYVKTERLTEGPFNNKICYWLADGYKEGYHIHPCFFKNGIPGNLHVAPDLFSINKGILSNYENYVIQKNNKSINNYRLYNLYDHCFITRMITIEKGDFKSIVTNYRGINNFVGLGRYVAYGARCDGLILSPDGSGEMIQLSIGFHSKYSGGADHTYARTCMIDTVDGVDLGDIYIFDPKTQSKTFSNGSFGCAQDLRGVTNYGFSIRNSLIGFESYLITAQHDYMRLCEIAV